jgi:hypothetical protein
MLHQLPVLGVIFQKVLHPGQVVGAFGMHHLGPELFDGFAV